MQERGWSGVELMNGVQAIYICVSPYSPHHLLFIFGLQERGWSGVELMNGVRNCWVKDIELINPDNGVMVNCEYFVLVVVSLPTCN